MQKLRSAHELPKLSRARGAYLGSCGVSHVRGCVGIGVGVGGKGEESRLRLIVHRSYSCIQPATDQPTDHERPPIHSRGHPTTNTQSTHIHPSILTRAISDAGGFGTAGAAAAPATAAAVVLVPVVVVDSARCRAVDCHTLALPPLLYKCMYICMASSVNYQNRTPAAPFPLP